MAKAGDFRYPYKRPYGSAGVAGAARLLVASEIKRRRRVFLLLALVFGGSTTSLLVLLGSVAGVEAAIGTEIEATLASDWRLADGRSGELAEGAFRNRTGALADRLETALPGAEAAARIEVQGLFLHTSRYEDFDAGLIVGLDPARDGDAADLPSRIVDGHTIETQNLWFDGKPYPQLVVGDQMLDALGMRVWKNGTLSPENVLQVSAGRYTNEGANVRPVVKEGVVVGVFRTGFGPIDRYTVFLHIATARELLRVHLDDDPANVLLLRAPPGLDVAAAARAEGLNATTSDAFRGRYLAAVFDPLRTFTSLVSAVVLVLAGGWGAHTAAAAILGDAKRIAVLRALGLPTRLVLGPVAALVVAAGAAGAAAGAALAWTLARAVRPGVVDLPGLPQLRFEVALTPGLVGALLAAVLATAALAAAVAGLALRRIPVTDALRE